jgi:hypothetical protein
MARCPNRDARAASTPTVAETVLTARPQFTWWGASWRDGETLSCTRGVFKCGVAKILALFKPDAGKRYADFDGLASKKWAALETMCASNAIPMPPPDALRGDEEVKRYAHERELVLLKDQLVDACNNAKDGRGDGRRC